MRSRKRMIVDNIDVNGQLVGQGAAPQAGQREGDDGDEDHHDD
jgi:hypothetical protein